MRALIDIFAQVFRSIGANKLRSFLTMFGIAWGGLSPPPDRPGRGFPFRPTAGLAQLGQDVIMTWGGTIPAMPNQHTGMRPYKLTVEDAEAIRNETQHVRDVTAFLNRGDLKQVSEFSSSGGSVLGVQANYPDIRHVPLVQGRFISQEDIAQRRRVVVLGQKNNKLLFPGRPSLGAFITVNGSRFQVIGVADKIGRGNNDGDNQRLYVPLSTMLELFPMTGENIPPDAVTSIQYQPTVPELNETAKAEVHRVIADRHGFDFKVKDAFEEWDTIKSERTVGLIFTAMDVFLGGVGIVTLALGAVGIINIMLVTVTERTTRRSGLRKALGATNRSILTQFFLEGLMLTGLQRHDRHHWRWNPDVRPR